MKTEELQIGKRHEDLEKNGNTTTLLFFLKGLEILHQERKGHVNIIGMEHFNSILSHKSEPGN